MVVLLTNEFFLGLILYAQYKLSGPHAPNA